MNGFIGGSWGNLLFGLVAMLSLAALIYLCAYSFRHIRLQRQRQRKREQLRREFWGYE